MLGRLPPESSPPLHAVSARTPASPTANSAVRFLLNLFAILFLRWLEARSRALVAARPGGWTRTGVTRRERVSAAVKVGATGRP